MGETSQALRIRVSNNRHGENIMSGGGSEQSTKQEIDPRMAALLYGSGGNTGLYGQAQALAAKNPSGINDRMRQGLDQQYNYLTSPQYTQGYQQLLGLGSNLMSKGAAGNPFTGGGGVSRSGSMGFGAMPSYLPALQQQQAQQQQAAPMGQGGTEQRSAFGSATGGASGGGPQGYMPQGPSSFGISGGQGYDPSAVWSGGGYVGAPVEDHSFSQVPVDDHSTGYGTGGGFGGAGTWKSWYDELIGKH